MRKILSALKRIAHRLLQTKADEWYWRFRHIHDGSWGERYVASASLRHPHREFLLDTISQHAPFTRVLEIGCASGPNLIRMAERFRGIELWGIDISQHAISVGLAYLKKNNISNIHLRKGNLLELTKYSDKSFDILFSDAVLIYVGPEKIKQVLREMIRLARKTIILVEWWDEGSYVKRADHWAYNWKLLFHEMKISRVKVTHFSKDHWEGEWTKCGCLVEASIS